MILDKHKIDDEAMYKALYNFIESDTASSKDTKSACSKARYELTPLFHDIKLSDINKNKVIDILTACSYTTITQRFLLYLCNQNYISKDNDLRIITPFHETLSKMAKDNHLLYLLKSDIATKFITLHPDIHKHEVTLFFCDVNKINFKDAFLRTQVSNYMDYVIKLSTEGTVGSIQNKAHEIVHISHNFLSKITLKELTRKNILKYLSMDWTRNGTMLEFNKFLCYINDLKLLEDNDLKIICSFKDAMTALTFDKYIELLNAPQLDRYFIRTIKKSNRLLFANVENDELYEALKEYAIGSTESTSTFVGFLQDFDKSIDGIEINSLNDLSIDTFSHQINYYNAAYEDKDVLSFVVGFYFLVASKYNPRLFIKDGFDPRILQKIGLAHLLVNGYVLIKYNPIEDVPASDKWIFCYSSDDETNSMTSTSNTKVIDFTVINNTTYRYWYKYYVWKNNNSLYTRLHSISCVTDFFNYIDNLKKGSELSIYARKSDSNDITLNEIIAWKNHVMNTYDNNRTRSSHIYNPRNILKFVHENGIVELPNGIYYYLTHKLDSNYDNTKAIPDENLKKLSKLMSEKADEEVVNAVYYLAFYIALETEFRASQLFTLKTDCVVETSKKNEYVLVSKTKTSANEEIEQPITIYVKKHIDEILKLTKKYREDNNISNISSYLFLAPGERKNSYKIISPTMFNTYLKKCCKEIGLPAYSYQNLRDTHMTKAEEFIIRNQMSDMEQNILSGHRSPNVDTKHYVDTQIKELLESVHGVIIGNVDVSGKIKDSLPADITTNENSVSNNCGYCKCKNCEDYSFLDCMLCKDFVTTIDRLPYFEEQVKIIDEKIKNATIPHDKEDLVNIKRLHLGFINKILELKSTKGEINNVST